MALSFKEKRALQKTVAAKQEELAQGGLGFRDKRAAQKAMNAALEKLNAKVEAGATSPLLADLIAGKFNDLPPLRFLGKLEEVVKSLDGDVEPVKEPVVEYVKVNGKEDGAVLESAFQKKMAVGWEV